MTGRKRKKETEAKRGLRTFREMEELRWQWQNYLDLSFP
jgi:hypothetical protein